VTGTEYTFQGVPKTAQQGPLAIKFTNGGAEVHELGIARIKQKGMYAEVTVEKGKTTSSTASSAP
jgi:hypothetical protein